VPSLGAVGRSTIRILTRVLAVGLLLCGASAPAFAQDSLLQRPLIRGLAFRGNRGLDDYTLAVSIATSNSSWWVRTGLVSWIGLGQRRYFDEREFRRDVLRLKLLYSQAGYPEARIDTVVTRTPSAVSLTFQIDEGPPLEIVDLTVTGTEDIVPAVQLERRLPLRVGEPFNRLLLGGASDSILVALQDRGYPFADVFRAFEVDQVARTASVTFDVVPGAKAWLGEIEVVGAQRVREGAIRRALPVRTGQLYRRKDLLRAQRELYALGAFDYVDVRLADTVPPQPGDSVVNLRLAVREGRFHRIRVAPGYGTEDCFRLLAGFTASRVLGGLRRLDATARLSKIGTGAPFDWGLQNNLCRGLSRETDPDRLTLNYNLSVGLSEPALFGRTIGGALSVFAERRSEVEAYVREGFGGEVSLTVRTPWDMPITLSYALGRASTKASPASTCFYLNVCREDDITVYQDPRREAVLGLVVLRNRQNSLLNPSRGSFASAEVRWSSGLIGSDSLAAFTKVQGQYAQHHRVGRHGVLSWRVGAGTLLDFERVSIGGEERFYVPPEHRFYGGGANSIRGFGQNELGPVVRVIEADSSGSVVDTLPSASGGTDLVLANVEWRSPLPGFGGRVQWSVFLDVGQVFDRKDDVAQDPGLRFTPGVGLRFITGVGPIRLDVGYNGYAPRAGPLYEAQGGDLVLVNPSFAPPRSGSVLDRLRLHFSVGQAF